MNLWEFSSVYIYIWCSKGQIIPLIDYFVKERKCNYEIILWNKPNCAPLCGTHLLVDKEICLLFWETGVYFHAPYERAKTIYQTNLNTKDKKEYKHPTIKPLPIIKNFVLNSSKEGDIILDPFMGSGTTGVACKELGREFIGFEKIMITSK